MVDYSRFTHVESSDDEKPPPQPREHSENTDAADRASAIGATPATYEEILGKFRELIIGGAWTEVSRSFQAFGSSDAFAMQVVNDLVRDEDCTSALFESIALGDVVALSIVGFILNSNPDASDFLVVEEAGWLAMVAHLGNCDTFEGWEYFVAGFVVPAVRAKLPVVSAVYDRVHALCRQLSWI